MLHRDIIIGLAVALLSACGTAAHMDAGPPTDAGRDAGPPTDAGRDAGLRADAATRPRCESTIIDSGPADLGSDSGVRCCCCGTVVPWHGSCLTGACDGFCP